HCLHMPHAVSALLTPPPSRSTLFPYTTLFRSIEITQGVDNPIPIAVVPFSWEGASALGEDVGGIVSADLQQVGEFRALPPGNMRSEEHTSELQSRENLVCRLLLEKKKGPRAET